MFISDLGNFLCLKIAKKWVPLFGFVGSWGDSLDGVWSNVYFFNLLPVSMPFNLIFYRSVFNMFLEKFKCFMIQSHFFLSFGDGYFWNGVILFLYLWLWDNGGNLCMVYVSTIMQPEPYVWNKRILPFKFQSAFSLNLSSPLTKHFLMLLNYSFGIQFILV